MLVGLNLLGVPGVWFFIGIRTFRKSIFLVKLSMGRAEESKGTKYHLERFTIEIKYLKSVSSAL